MTTPGLARARRGPLAFLLAVAVAAVPGCGGKGDGRLAVLRPGERMPEGMTVTSTAFADGAPVPERFSCEGENVPPPLRWTGTPAGTTELALVIEDPDAPDGTFVHWLVVGIDPARTSVGPDEPPGGEVLPGSSDNPTYIGPCPPDGDGPHRYHFEVYALRARPRLPAEGDPVARVRAVRRAAAGGGVLVGTFAR